MVVVVLLDMLVLDGKNCDVCWVYTIHHTH